MPTVKFSAPDDFLEELAKDKEKVDRGIVRLVYSFTPTNISPNIQHLSVVATALVAGQVYRLETYCGDLWASRARTSPSMTTASRSKSR